MDLADYSNPLSNLLLADLKVLNYGDVVAVDLSCPETKFFREVDRIIVEDAA